MAPRDPEHRSDGSARDEGVEPEFPGAAGVAVPELPIEKVESERILENEVRGRLESDGFSDEQILRWLEAYFAQHDEGEPDEVVAWIRDQESGRGQAERPGDAGTGAPPPRG